MALVYEADLCPVLTKLESNCPRPPGPVKAAVNGCDRPFYSIAAPQLQHPGRAIQNLYKKSSRGALHGGGGGQVACRF